VTAYYICPRCGEQGEVLEKQMPAFEAGMLSCGVCGHDTEESVFVVPHITKRAKRLWLDNSELLSAAEALEEKADILWHTGGLPGQVGALKDTAKAMRRIANVALAGKPTMNDANLLLPTIWIAIQGTTKEAS